MKEQTNVSDFFLATKTIIYLLIYFGLRELSARVFTQGEDFPEENSKGPHVTLAGVHLVEDALGGHPLQRQASLDKNRPM